MSRKRQAPHKVKPALGARENFQAQEQTSQTAPYIAKLRTELEVLKRHLFQWSVFHQSTGFYGRRDKEILTEYIEAQHDYYEYNQFDSGFFLLENWNVPYDRINDEGLIFKSFKLFRQAKWPLRFHSRFVSKLKDYPIASVYYILGFVYFLACGNIGTKYGMKTTWGYSRAMDVKTVPLNRFFTCKLFHEKNLFYHIGVEKVPVVRNGVIKRYEYQSYIQFLDILGDQFVENKAKCNQRMEHFMNQTHNDVAKKDHSDQIEIELEKGHNKLKYLFYSVENAYTGKIQFYHSQLSDSAHEIYYPLKFKPYYVSQQENTTMIFDKDLRRWVSKDHLNFMERKKMIEYQKQISDQMVKRFVDFQSAKALVELLTKIPNFKIKLTQQEKQVIGENGNVLAIGRSGTGKTTCAVLRLFSIEMLFKIRLSLYKKKYKETVKDVRCGSDDIDDALGLHCIFLTASPVLTHEIQRYYKKLTDNIKDELEKKKQKVRAERQAKEEVVVKEEKAQDPDMPKIEERSFEELNESKEEESKEPADLEIPDKLQAKKSAQDIEEEEELNKEFEDIKLKEEIEGEDFKEDEDEDLDEVKRKFEESVKKFHSLMDLQQSDYPGFFTVKSYIMLVDGVLAKPFFIRNKKAMGEEESKASWHNERKGVMMIENYFRGEEKDEVDVERIEEEINYSDEEELEHEYLRQIQLRENREKQQLTKKLQEYRGRNLVSFEVDYEYFLVHFWPRMVKKYYSSRIITPHLVWTQIYSTIKGSAEAHQYPGQYLTEHAYISTSTNGFLTREEKLDIYETFCQYERWKIRAGGYDIMDTVNYILNYIRFRGYDGPEIHYVMIDEVQDLPHAILYLLSKTASYGVFYSGDTAQTIAKGVGFRFCDLKSLFNPKNLGVSLGHNAPIVKHLTVNFRSHNNILQLANSVVSSIEILFPKTIDRMRKEVSDLNGPKPMILSPGDEELLFYVLCGGDERGEGDAQGIKKPALEFGCDQVIIVRDQQSKAKVPAMLQHALCLTVYEAKGLEFNDVILFNFFSETPCGEKWPILSTLRVAQFEIPKEDYERNLSKHREDDEQVDEVPVQENFNKEKNIYRVKKLVSDNRKNRFKDINDFAEVCSELKLLYTAITRPRKTLIIYDDEQTHSRHTLQKIWDRLDVIELIDKDMVVKSLNEHTNQTAQVKVFQKIVAATDNKEWKQQGLRMYARGYFDQAMKCFQRSGHDQLYRKAEANKYADEATKKLIEIESERNAIKQPLAHGEKMGSSDVARIKKNLKAEESLSLQKFENAGFIFESLEMHKQAGQCFFSGKLYERALECFQKAKMYKQAAQSLEMQKHYREAAEYYEKEDNYLKVIECLDLINEWALIIQKVHKFSHLMSSYEKQALLKKYSALALEELVYEIEFENEEDEKKPENQMVEVIQEQESDEEDEEDEDSEEDQQLAEQRAKAEKLQKEKAEREQAEEKKNDLIEIQQSVYQPEQEPKQQQDESGSFSALNDSEIPQASQEEPKPETEVKKEAELKSVEMSFDDLNSSTDKPEVLQASVLKKEADLQSLESFGDLNAKFDSQVEPDLESIKSMVDADDMWVKNSISQIHKLQSEYSVIDDEEENYNINVKIIKTKGNIFVQDEIMRKIINIVSVINASVESFFQQFKGYQSLMSLRKEESEGPEVDQRPEISQFEDIDPKFIQIILDTLESFKLFKLCLFVCNRYHMPAQAGRYLISMGMKYSTNCISDNRVNPVLLAPSAYRKTELEKGILASIALHAIYENVNSDFLKIKVAEQENPKSHSLGTYFIQGLILEGLFKKAVFMVNPQQSLKILSNYNDFEAYNTLYRQKIRKVEQPDLVEFPQTAPKKADEVEYVTMLLRKAMFDYGVVHRFETVSLRYYREFEQNKPLQMKEKEEKLREVKLPEYLPFCRALWDKETLFDQLQVLIFKAYNTLQRGSSLQVLDVVCCLLTVIHSEQFMHQLVATFSVDAFLELYRCVYKIRGVISKLTGSNALQVVEAVMSMHQCYRVRHCKSMEFLNDTYCFVHRTSTVANELVDNSKEHPYNFAYFFEQDYNLILAKTSRVLKVILKKYDAVVVKLFRWRKGCSVVHHTMLHEDYTHHEEEMVLKKALDHDIRNLVRDKRKKKKEGEKELKKVGGKKVNSIEFKSHGKEYYYMLDNDSESEDETNPLHNRQQRFYRVNSNPRLRYLAAPMIALFEEHARHSKEAVEGKELYCSGLNSLYREYTEKMGGYNLFDALEFARFKRIDLYAENVLSVYDQLTLFSKHCFAVEILSLLLVQFKTMTQGKECAVQLTTGQLKYLPGLSFAAQNGQEAEKLTKSEVNYLLVNQEACRFNYRHEWVSDMNAGEIAGLICDWLDIIKNEEASQFVNFQDVVLSYVLNVDRGHQSTEINESIRRIVNLLAREWKYPELVALADNSNLNHYYTKREEFLQSKLIPIGQPIHTISLTNHGDLDKVIEESEFDYELEGRIIKGKKKAVTKIARWWRAKRRELKQKLEKGNYFEKAVDDPHRSLARMPDSLGDTRLIQCLRPQTNVLVDLEFLLDTEKVKDELLSFYLTNTIVSSLDLHFILMSLNKVSECRYHYSLYCSQDPDQLHNYDLQDIKTEVGELLSTIDIWKKDEKWLREKKLNLKRKKVFEVKWMTKNVGLNSIIKKRAGLKKQDRLQTKKMLLKRGVIR